MQNIIKDNRESKQANNVKVQDPGETRISPGKKKSSFYLKTKSTLEKQDNRYRAFS